MTESDNTNRDDFSLTRRLKDLEVPWPDLVSAYLMDIKNRNTSRAYMNQLVEWLPQMQSYDLHSIGCEELVQIRGAILRDSRSNESHRQALAALKGCFLAFREQRSLRNLHEDTIERIFGSEMAYQRMVIHDIPTITVCVVF